ncbi:anti-sigma factor [Ornithinimicrobium cavernae]|uniref:anti-sigma factor n=1 Tax=Ornithinimicrobium cavernae TaxID=2666047 RepID=UPI000D689B7C|nr:anti-sigma factor [Ornithinimicrobium cavernae]
MSQQTPGAPGEDVHSLAAAYALDAVDPDERAAFEEHLAGCAACRTEVAELAEATVALSEHLSVEPPPALRAQLLREIATTPQEGTPRQDRGPRHDGPDELGERRTRRARRSRGGGWLLAGVAAATIAVGTVAVTQWPQDTPDPSVVAVQEVLDAPDAVRTTESVDGATVTVVTASSLERAVVLTEDMTAAPSGQDYQLWFVHEDGTAVSAGLMPRDGDQVLLEGEPAGAVAVGITIEPAGGSEQPTSDPIVAVPLEG